MTFIRYLGGRWSEYLRQAINEPARGDDLPEPYKTYVTLLLTLADWNEPGHESAKLPSLLDHLKARGCHDLITSAENVYSQYRHHLATQAR